MTAKVKMRYFFNSMIKGITYLSIWLLPTGNFWFATKRSLLILCGIKVGRNVQIWQGVRILPLMNITLGSNVAIGFDVMLRPEGGLVIGNDVLIGHGTKIITSNHVIPPERGRIFGSGHFKEKVIINDGVWIASNVIILPGVILGEGCVVAAGAVVTHDVPSYAIVGGVPARLIRMRD